MRAATASCCASDHAQERQGLDLLRVPVLGRFLRWRRARLTCQLALLAAAAAVVLHGLFGPQLAPKNLATLLVWVHWRGLLVLSLLAVGNVFCFACPFLLPRELARRFRKPTRNLPRPLRTKWLSIGLLVALLFCYELFDLWGSPAWTAGLILLYFAAALLVDSVFKGASFCKSVCPIGQFNFAASTMSPFEVRRLDADACVRCRTKDCIRGRRDEERRVLQRGCELALYLPLKEGNVDCTFCLDCVQACPHDNVGIVARSPGAELASDALRSGIGRFLRHRDWAALAVVFTFGGLLNAFGMVRPVYAVQQWLAGVLGTRHETPVLAVLFLAGLVLLPAVLLLPAGLASRRLSGAREELLPLLARNAFALVPLGLGIWLAHYSFHLLTGLWTFVPVAQSALADLGAPILGAPHWGLGGLRAASVWPVELGFLGLGLAGSMAVAWRLARDHGGPRATAGFVPWAAVLALVFGAAVWLMRQPMEMRGTFL